jgi:putative transposase
MCELLSVSCAGYYDWRERPLSLRATDDAVIQTEIAQIYTESRRIYGRPRIHEMLLKKGRRIGQKRVRRLMKALKISGVRRRQFRKTTNSHHALPIAPNALDREFDVSTIGAPNRVWAGDITYLQTREGWLYLAVVLDLYSRRVVGWSMGSSMQTDLVVRALQAALRKRRPGRGVMFHSDRGCQHASAEYRALLLRYGMIASMSRKGECWDNAVVESFFGSMKTELGDPIWATRADARAMIFDYIEIWYNRERLHSTLNYSSPENFESQLPIAA